MLRRPRIGRGRVSFTPSGDISFISRGQVVECIPLQGSFINVKVERDDGSKAVHTVNMSEDFTFPKLGDRIQVTGIFRNKRYITKEWKFV